MEDLKCVNFVVVPHLYLCRDTMTTNTSKKVHRVDLCVIINTSAGRSLGFSLSMFVSDICDQTSNISDYGVESVKKQIKSNTK